MSKPVISRRAISLLCGVFVWGALQTNLANAGPAEQYVERVGSSVLAAARTGSVSSFRSLMQRNAAIPSIAIYSLGRYRKKLPAGRKAEFYRLVTSYIAGVFARYSKRLAARSIKAVSSRDRGREVIVKSKLRYPSGKTSNVTWRLIKRGGSFKIFDINVQGIWLAGTQKTDFTTVLRRNNGDINALFSYLKK